MHVHSVSLENYGPFRHLEEVKLGQLATIVGQNDVGKSTILRALEAFLERDNLAPEDLYNGAGPDDRVAIEITFSGLPDTVELERDVETTLKEEMLLDETGLLRIRRTYDDEIKKEDATLIAYDFDEDDYAALGDLTTSQLDKVWSSLIAESASLEEEPIDKRKRADLRRQAKERGTSCSERQISLSSRRNLRPMIRRILPKFHLFETDTRLGVDETSFQREFRPIVNRAARAPAVLDARDRFTGSIKTALQNEVAKLFERLKRHTNDLANLEAEPSFSWEKAVTVDILGEDRFGIQTSLDRRGSGMRRLLMVAFFEYLAEEKGEGDKAEDYVYAVEEPENCLHPGLQRELVGSFRELAEDGYQIIITSHSPVFAGGSPTEDLALITREGGEAGAVQGDELDLGDVARELGVELSDQITSYNACVFVEGPTDITFWHAIAKSLKRGGHVECDCDDKNIGFIPTGGETLRHWVELEAMSHLSREFAVVVDSDKKAADHNIPGRKRNWKRKVEARGGRFFILRKREIENYLHRDALTDAGCENKQYDDYTDMKKLFGENVLERCIQHMPCERILEMDAYGDNQGNERHELLEIVAQILDLC